MTHSSAFPVDVWEHAAYYTGIDYRNASNVPGIRWTLGAGEKQRCCQHSVVKFIVYRWLMRL